MFPHSSPFFNRPSWLTHGTACHGHSYLIYCLALQRPSLGFCLGDSLTHLMLIIALFFFDPKVTMSIAMKLSSKGWVKAQRGLNRQLFSSKPTAQLAGLWKPTSLWGSWYPAFIWTENEYRISNQITQY